ncbi:MAG: TOBE domain-containing protein, partial [Geminicoccaceae bacterium]
LMLRPEQLRLAPAAPGEADAACHGLVTEVEYGGAVSTVTVALPAAAAGAAAMPPLLIRCPSDNLPVPGARVLIAVHGTAHVF